ncbi:MAG: hypothetical protein AMJ79_07575 [Phycisphaerae bacterium SM23_30]|nr:MAG: hypothetical protein AMJ79_07575 [Phycisphaerae bacterium SM23_30]
MLVLVLWVLVILAVLAADLALDTRLDSSVRLWGADRVRARWLARAGVNRALSEIAADTSSTDAVGDHWFDNPDAFDEVLLAGGSFTVYADRFKDNNSCAYGVVDEASKVNLNTATREMLRALPGMTEARAEAIVNLRQQRQQDPAVGFEEALAGQPAYPRGLSRGGFNTIRELGWVDQMTHILLYGEDTNFNGVLENNENDKDNLPPEDNGDKILDRGILSYVTVYSFEYNRDGAGLKRLNINFAERQTLQSKLGLHSCYVNWILKNRGGGFAGIAHLLDDTVSKEDTDPGELLDPKKSVPLDAATFRRIADNITVTDAEVICGRININTASQTVLQALPGVDSALAERIIERRGSRAEGFSSIAALLTMDEIDIEHFQKLAPLITVRSNVFTIRSMGRAEGTGIKHYIEAVAAREGRDLTVLYWKENR